MTLLHALIFSAVVLSLAVLTACSPDADRGTQELDATQSAPVSYLEQAGLSGAAVALAGDALAEALRPTGGIEIRRTDAGVALSNSMEGEAASAGQTTGVDVEIPASTADAISGQNVTVTIVARSMDDGGLRAAYFTNQVGNSGWRDQTLNETFAPVSFQYSVPSPDGEAVNADFLRLAPLGGTVEIAAVAVAISD